MGEQASDTATIQAADRSIVDRLYFEARAREEAEPTDISVVVMREAAEVIEGLVEALETVTADAESYFQWQEKDRCPWMSVRVKTPAALAKAKGAAG